MLELHAVRGKTGRLLKQLLSERGLFRSGAGVTAYVSYGVRLRGMEDVPVLNENAGRFNKLQELEAMRGKNVRTVPFDTEPSRLRFPVLGRTVHHTKGRDIVLFPSVLSLGRRVSKPVHFYTQLIHKQREYRVWCFRKNILAVYEKRLRYPRRLRRTGANPNVWNWRNGYAFELFQGAPQELKDIGRAAVRALELDFGAVDVIQGMDGNYYVLEVNTAPGTQGPRQGLVSLVSHIEKWLTGGFKKRGTR